MLEIGFRKETKASIRAGCLDCVVILISHDRFPKRHVTTKVCISIKAIKLNA